ncbi:MAG: amino acid permease [Candidatus Nanopelagicales bacterium]
MTKSGGTINGPSRRAGLLLLVGFVFTIMADPVSSVAYAIEAATRELGGDLRLLVATITVVVAVVGFVALIYARLIKRYPHGRGASAAVAEAFGTNWSFLPMAALVVDFVLTIAVSISAATSAVISYWPTLGAWRMPIAIGLLVIVSTVTWFGSRGRMAFAALTLAFITVASAVIVGGLTKTAAAASSPGPANGRWPVIIILLAFPVAMALATGIEAPSTAIGALTQLDNRTRTRFGRVGLWATVAIVGALSIGLAYITVKAQIGIPTGDVTQIALTGQWAAPNLFAVFQACAAVLLLAAAASSLNAGPGLLEAIADSTAGRSGADDQTSVTPDLPTWIGMTNQRGVPYIGVALFAGVAGVLILVSRAHEQNLVPFYAIAVFVSFLSAMAAMAKFDYRVNWRHFSLDVVGLVIVSGVLFSDLLRGWPIVSLAATGTVALALAWSSHGARAVRPHL